MPSFSSVDWTEDGVGNPLKIRPPRAHHRRAQGPARLRRVHHLGLEGIHQIPDPSDPANGGRHAYKVRTGVNAGTDMFMEPFSAAQFETLLLLVKQPAGSAWRASTTR